MKRLLTLLILLLASASAFSQSWKAIFFNPNVYRTQVDIKAVRVTDIELDKIYNDTVMIKVSGKNSDLGHLDYKIVNEDENGYIIFRVLPKAKIIEETSPSDDGSSKTDLVLRHTNGSLLKEAPENAYRYYFAVKKDGFKPLAKTLLSTKIVGVPLVHPFKLRPEAGPEGWTLAPEFTLSYSFGVRLKLSNAAFKQNFITLIPYGFGVGATKYYKEKADGTLSEKTDAVSVTYYQGGVLLTLHKINFGIFGGFDAMIDKQKDWLYQGKPWFSFGLGYKFKDD